MNGLILILAGLGLSLPSIADMHGKMDEEMHEEMHKEMHGGEGAKQEMKERPGDWKEYLVKELNLSKEQANQLDTIKNKYDPEISKLKKTKWDLKKELWEMSRQPDKGEAFEKKLTAKHEAVQEAEDMYDDKRFEMMLEAREVLEPDQIANLDDVMKKKWKYHKWKHNNRGKTKSTKAE